VHYHTAVGCGLTRRRIFARPAALLRQRRRGHTARPRRGLRTSPHPAANASSAAGGTLAAGAGATVGLRHACGYALANKGHDTRALQAYLGHKNIQHTVRYTELSPDRFKDFWR
jgi:integrase